MTGLYPPTLRVPARIVLASAAGQGQSAGPNTAVALPGPARTLSRDSMALLFVFLLGIANFAVHRAVLESGHPILLQIGWLFRSLGGRLSLMAEFMLLVGTMLLVASGAVWWALGYLAYSLINGFSAWLILSGRV